MAEQFVVSPSVAVRDDAIEGRHGQIRLRRYQPSRGTATGAPVLVWGHGGAFAWGGLDQLEAHAVAATIAARGFEVVSVEYRLAPRFSWFGLPVLGRRPGHRFPVPMDDLVDAFSSVAESASGPVVLGGASAGACLSAAAALQLRDARGTAPARLLLAYGTFHSELPPIDAELRSRTRGRHAFTQFSPKMVERMNRNYAGQAQRSAFPGGADLRGLPPTTLIDADRDTLRASGRAFAEELRSAGVDVDYSLVSESTHGFLDRPSAPAFSRGIDIILRALALTSRTERT